MGYSIAIKVLESHQQEAAIGEAEGAFRIVRNLDPKDESPAVVSGVRPVECGGPGPSEVESSGRTGCVAGSSHGARSISLPAGTPRG